MTGIRALRTSTRARTYLMCPPEYFAVTYAINPWMNPAEPVDRDRALAQWQDLRDTFVRLGHTVHTITPEPGLPDMVFAANGGTVIGGQALGARFETVADADRLFGLDLVRDVGRDAGRDG